ncbi:MAG: selenocysteine-specific translation elongation factor [Aquabacterium sp.]
MIVGTAGHIDHGKTTLVKALTGVDTDRLPQEKQRGISIELGYAFLDTTPASDDAAAGARIGFIDVPGHERLVHTMLAGATGIDLALLLVAADDGPMPQTHEHLAVLSLLGIRRGAMVLTKVDRADAQRRAAVRREAEALLAPSSLAGAPVFEVSATSGEGLAALRDWLLGQAQQSPVGRDPTLAFRLAVDRAFTLGGVGTVATGTVFAGAVRDGDELALVPGDARLRVRSVHADNRPVEQADCGQRCAVALAGIAKEAVPRGHWLCAPAVALQTDRFDAELRLWHAETRPLRSGQAVLVHVGSAAQAGTVAVLQAPGGGDVLAPGESGLVQVVLRQPLAVWVGDRVVLRDAAASRTLAGGRILDPFAPTRYRRTPARLAELAARQLPGAAARVAALLAAAPVGLDLQRWCQAEGLLALPALPEGLLRVQAAAVDMALGAAAADAVLALVLPALRDFHQRAPEELGPDTARLRRLAAPRLPLPLWRGLLERWLAQGLLRQRGAVVHLPEHGLRLSAVDERIAQKTGPMLLATGFEGAWVRDLARDAAEGEVLMRTTLARLAQRGDLHQVVRDLYYAEATMLRLAALVRQVAQAEGEVRAASFRDATGLGRKRAIQVLEYFDRIGLLRRVGDSHRLRPDSALFPMPAAPETAPKLAGCA